MKFLPTLAVTLLLALGGLSACGDDTQNANETDGAATSSSDETESGQETEDAPAESEDAETSEATNPDVIAYCDVVATMAKLQKAGKDFGAETAKLSDLTAQIGAASSDGDLTAADNDALSECGAQLEEVYKG